MNVIQSRGVTLAALVIGAGPGFLLPVVITWKLPLDDAAALLLTITLAQIAFAALGAPYETTMLVKLGARYGTGEVRGRLPILALSMNALSRIGPALLIGAAALITAAGALASDIRLTELAPLAVPVVVGQLVQASSAPLSAHLFAVRRLPPVYFATFFLGGPSLFAALIWRDALAISVAYLVGQMLRWGFLAWRVVADGSNNANEKSVIVEPPTLRELAPQILSSITGQLMPMLVQGILAASGAAAVSAGAIALRVWGAAWQAGTSTLAMPEVVTLARELRRLEHGRISRWLDRRALRIVLVSTGLALVVGVAITTINMLPGGRLPSTILLGLWWSLIALLAFPFGMLNFWAGRGLITVGAGWWLPVLVVVAFVGGGAISLLSVPHLGGIGAIIGFSAGMILQGTTTYVVFRKLAPRATLM